MSALTRRVLPLADCKVSHLTAADGTIQIKGHGLIGYTPLCAEHYEELLKYMSEDVARTREFLLSDSADWVERGGRVLPVYLIGWPSGPKIEVVGGKACAEALRRFYPARDYQGQDAAENAAAVTPAPPVGNVVRFNQPSATAVIKGLLDQRRWESRE